MIKADNKILIRVHKSSTIDLYHLLNFKWCNFTMRWQNICCSIVCVT